jgi:hypothetical protein
MARRSNAGAGVPKDGGSAPPGSPQNEILSLLPAKKLAAILEHAEEVSYQIRDEYSNRVIPSNS